jgi:hypothetical protein
MIAFSGETANAFADDSSDLVALRVSRTTRSMLMFALRRFASS